MNEVQDTNNKRQAQVGEFMRLFKILHLGWSDNTEVRALVLHVGDPDLIPIIPYGHLSLASIDSQE